MQVNFSKGIAVIKRVKDQSYFFAGNDATVIKVATSDPENSSYKPISKFDTVNKGLFIGNKPPIN